jgi:DNA-binding CsgD family transcriptional regulator
MPEIELSGEDYNTFAELGRSPRRAGSLSEATGGDLDRSLRHRELMGPNGFGDELRVALVDDSTAWGGLVLLRGADQPDFAPAESALLASMSRHLADGLRRAMLLPPGPDVPPPEERAAGFALVAPDNSIASADAAGEAWLAELREGEADGPPPTVVVAVAGRARRIAAGAAPADAIARARARTASGKWVLVRGSTLGEAEDGQTAVIIEPAQPGELAPLVAHAYELTGRERAVTELVARGLSTDAIAARLYISPWTVQDHLKAIFEKLGATNRGELVSRVFFDHAAPRLAEPVPDQSRN